MFDLRLETVLFIHFFPQEGPQPSYLQPILGYDDDDFGTLQSGASSVLYVYYFGKRH